MPWQGERFEGTIGMTMEGSTPSWSLPQRPPEGTPNVVLVVLDDVGYGHLGCYGSPIQTPTIDALAAEGLRYTNWHTTALCSPTRACLLTGRNHHTTGMGIISELAAGFPGYDGVAKPSRGYVSEILQERGYATLAIGKWHQVPAEEISAAGPYRRWPLGRGFDRFYGFLGAETDQYAPDLVHDNHYVEPPATAEEGYHLTEDLTDRAISFLRDLRSADPTKPFFLYFCPGATHAPHQVPSEWIERYRGAFDEGWDVYRERTHARQLELGIVPAGTELSPRHEKVKPWEELSDDERGLYARMMEVYAGFLTHTDHHLGRLVQALEELGERENTMIVVVSDNGASGEGGFVGTFNENILFNGLPDTLEANLERLDDLGSPRSYGHYPTGWALAGNTPFKRWKRNVFNGGISDPCIVSWPAGIPARGEIRHQYTHAIDVMPTILDVLGEEPPVMLKGIPQEEIAGRTMTPTFEDPEVEVRDLQYFEMYGSRALYRDGWKAVTFHAIPGIPADGGGDPSVPFVDDAWELYHVAEDFAEIHDLAEQEPSRLQEMVGMWFHEAGKYDVLPLHAAQRKGMRPKPFGERDTYVYWPGTTHVDNEVAVNVRARPFNVIARATIPPGGAEGVLIAQGGSFAGWSLFLHDGRLVYEHNFLGLERFRVTSAEPVPEGEVRLGLGFEVTGAFELRPDLTEVGVQGVSGRATLYVNGSSVGSGDVAKTVPFGWSLSGEGLCCGFDSETPVSELYASPFAFTGTIDRVVVSVSGEPFGSVAKDVENAFLIQ